MSFSEQRRDAARPDWLIMQSAETLRDSTRRGTSPFRRRFLRARRTITLWFVAGWLLRGDGVHIASALARSVSDKLHVTDSAGYDGPPPARSRISFVSTAAHFLH